jgi:hypothetical protein
VKKADGRDTIGFGCPNTTDPHHFVVEIPASRTGVVLIAEHYGVKAGINGLPEVAERCYLARPIWSQIAEDVKREFNERLRAKKMTASRWTTGVNKVERLLGKELLVLAWAVEGAQPETVPNAVRNWIGLRPEERWWLYTVTAAATGQPEDAEVGWRKALRFALTENPLAETMPMPSTKKRTTKQEPATQQALFPGFQEEEQSPFLEKESA